MTALSKAKEKLKELKQNSLLDAWDRLADSEQQLLINQIDQLDPKVFQEQQALLKEKNLSSISSLAPFQDYAKRGSERDSAAGKKLIAAGKVGCLIVAGGQGTRLRFDGPKGMFPVTAIKHKSLFQFFAERTLAAGKQAGRSLQLAIMTSPANHLETVSFFKKQDYFGLKKDQVSFFSQGMLPFLNQEGDLFLEAPSLIAEGPDGNGTVLKHFVKQGIWDRWKNNGVEYVNFVLIDNPLADPFDAELIGFQQREKADVVIKCVERRDEQEKVGVLLLLNESVKVVEYSEVPPDEFKARLCNGQLKYPLANISLFSFGMDFVFKAAEEYDRHIPFHKAFKAVKYLQDGKIKKAESPNAWKFEKFIFDVIPFAKNVKALLYPREDCFAPLKNAEGPDSIGEVQKALQVYDRKVFRAISKTEAPNKIFELSPEFYYPTAELIAKWKVKSLPNEDYIVP